MIFKECKGILFGEIPSIRGVSMQWVGIRSLLQNGWEV
jgi:hypothetical protein